VYLLTGGFLGRLCLSGELTRLSGEQWALVKQAISFYQVAAPLIARGASRLHQAVNPSWQHLQGAQVVLRLSEDRCSALAVAHSFGAPLSEAIHVPLPGPGWKITRRFPTSASTLEVAGDDLLFTPTQEWEGSAFLLAH
jgi:alpha-galactosidase